MPIFDPAIFDPAIFDAGASGSPIEVARSEVETAFDDAGIAFRDTWTGEPPYVVMFFDGSDLDPILGDGQTRVDFALVCVVSKANDDVALGAVDTLVSQVYAVMLSLAGWAIRGIDSLTRQTLGTDTMYVVTFRVSRMLNLAGG